MNNNRKKPLNPFLGGVDSREADRLFLGTRSCLRAMRMDDGSIRVDLFSYGWHDNIPPTQVHGFLVSHGLKVRAFLDRNGRADLLESEKA